MNNRDEVELINQEINARLFRLFRKELADSDDRSIVRIAELRSSGEKARPCLEWLGNCFLVTVRREDGSIED